MSNENFWRRKINALLHDPPDKPLDVKGHKGKAATWARILGINLTEQDFKEADWVASACDRLNFPDSSDMWANFTKYPYLSHPLSGSSTNQSSEIEFLTQAIDIDRDITAAIEQSLKNEQIEAIRNKPQQLFLWLWRNWSYKIQQIQGDRLGVLWDLLPADTRIPDHSIWVHQALTSAIAATDSNPGFLLFTIGPVQAFISAARRTQDLWAGSYLLAYLNWSAIEVIAEEIGPDAIIFPNLLEQPFCDRWLQEKHQILPVSSSSQPKNLILPSLPNRFLAIVPAERGVELAKKADERMRSQWRTITQKVRTDLEQVLGFTPKWSETWERQTENLFETYWQVYPWLPEGGSIQDSRYQFLNPHKPYLGKQRTEKAENILKLYAESCKKIKWRGKTYNPNIGAIYSDLYYITEKILGSRKGLRNFAQVEETGEKSTLGGDRAALHHRIDELQDNQPINVDEFRRKELRDFWISLAKKLKGNQIQPTGKERLDAVELTKRCAWQFYFSPPNSPDFPNELRFPSTNSIAAASFKKNVLEKLKDGNSKSLRQSLEKWINEIYSSLLKEGNTASQDVIPYLTAQISSSDDLLHKFLRLDGRLLFEETYDKEDEFIKKVSLSQRTQGQKGLKAFLEETQKYGIPKPRKYFAILMMDGDEMGKWLSGDKMPNYNQVLHPNTLQALEKLPDWKQLIENPRLMSPAIHGFISKALGDFSLKLVRYIVETRYPGKLVYAGGDDVLALLPLDSVLEVARELRAAFSGELLIENDRDDTDPEKVKVSFTELNAKAGYVWLKLPGENKPRLLATMGHKATASTGIVIAHRLSPLDLTLQEVRNAEKAAKNKEGRNAFSITFLKRSGEQMSAGAKWTYANKSIDTVKVLLKFQHKFADDSISGKFPYVLQEEAETLSLLEIPDLYKAEIKRLLLRQQGGNKLSKEVAKDLAGQLSNLVIHANEEKRSHTKDEDKAKPQEKLKPFADLLVFTRFLATGEGEED
jgi:CRISPR-associated protein Cmr2